MLSTMTEAVRVRILHKVLVPLLIYMCTCICIMCIYMCICIYVYIYTYVSICVYIYVYVYIIYKILAEVSQQYPLTKR